MEASVLVTLARHRLPGRCIQERGPVAHRGSDIGGIDGIRIGTVRPDQLALGIPLPGGSRHGIQHRVEHVQLAGDARIAGRKFGLHLALACQIPQTQDDGTAGRAAGSFNIGAFSGFQRR